MRMTNATVTPSARETAHAHQENWEILAAFYCILFVWVTLDAVTTFQKSSYAPKSVRSNVRSTQTYYAPVVVYLALKIARCVVVDVSRHGGAFSTPAHCLHPRTHPRTLTRTLTHTHAR